ncbi:hypothetical protein [Pontibacter sp. H249]|uniref:hypothetical protein n=1 Tax=Pontibacter sp. H249 TaxID=3133420 RepID=UPI0030C38D44
MNTLTNLIRSAHSSLTLKPCASYFARQFGYELVGEGALWKRSNYKLFHRKLPHFIHNRSEDPYTIPFKISLRTVTSRLGFSYANDGWHPFVQTLKEYEQNPELRYEDSTLAKLYERYCPRNVHEVLLDHISVPLKPFCDWPPKNHLIRWVWALNHTSVRKSLKFFNNNGDEDGWIFFGPHTPEYGQREFNRLIGVYESIKKNGYRTGLAGVDPVNGYFLKYRDKTRFVLLQGNHRISALKALGYTEVEVLVRRGHPAVVDREHLLRWTEGGGGIYSDEVVTHLFDALFQETGVQKAKRYNLA